MLDTSIIDEIKKAVHPFLQNGDKIWIKKIDDEIILEDYNSEEANKKYQLRAILRRYNTRSLVFWSLLAIILNLSILFLVSMIYSNIFENRYGIKFTLFSSFIFYLCLFIILISILNKMRILLLKIYINLVWRGLKRQLEEIGVDRFLIENTYDKNEEYKDLVNIIFDKYQTNRAKHYNKYPCI